MGNPLRGEAALAAGAVTCTLVCDVNAFVEMEAATGLTFNELLATVQGNPSFTIVRQVICAALQEKHPGTTLREAGKLMSDAGLTETVTALRTAIKHALPEVKDDGSRPPNRKGRRAAAAGTGSTS